MVMRQGGVTGRPGTQYVGTALNGGNQVRLVPFIFNETGLGQSYVLEFGNEYIAFYQNGGNIISSTKAISNITQQGIALVSSSAHGFSDGDIVTISSVLGMTQVNNGYFIVADAVADTFRLHDLLGNPIDSLGYGAYISGGVASKIYTIVSPYLQADLATLQFAQSADILTVVHPSYYPAELSRSGATSWALNNVIFGVPAANGANTIVTSGGGSGSANYEWLVTSVDLNGNESPASGDTEGLIAINTPSPTNPITITWQGPAGIPLSNVSYWNIYRANWVGTHLSTYGFVGTVPGTQRNFIDTISAADFTNTPPDTSPFESLMGAGYYPSTVGFIQQRRCFGAWNNNPIGFAMSKPGNFSNFDAHTGAVIPDDDPIFGSIAGNEINAIEHLTELKFALILSAGAEIYMQGNGSGVVTPSAINASVQSQYGSSALQPIKAGDILIFTQSLGAAIRDFAFDFAIDGYRGNDITIFSAHLFEGFQLNDWCYQKVPDSIVWIVRSDGVLLSCTYVREQQVLAWARHDFADGLVENVCSVPENGEYAVYASIKRVINGETVRYIERISSRLWPDTVNTPPVQNDPINASYLDAFLKYDGRNTSPITMTLSDGVGGIPAGDFIFTWTDQSGTHSATLTSAGGGSITSFLSVLMNTINSISTSGQSIVYFGSIVDDKVFIRNSSYAFQFAFTNGLQLLGWPFVGMSGPLMSVTAPDYPLTGFYQGETAYQQQLTITASAAFFNSGMVGNQIFFEDEEWIYSQGKKGNQVRCTIQTYTDSMHVTVTPNEAVPAEFQNIAVAIWARAVQTISGLLHLEGLAVSVWADRFVVGSPLNSQVTPIYTVSGGSITLDKPYSVIYVGLPMTQDLESLDLEAYFGETMLARRKRVSRLSVYLYNTRTFFCGGENPDTNENNTNDDPLFQLYEEKDGRSQATYDVAPELLTKQDYVIVPSRWTDSGRVFIRNVDPVPFSLLAMAPSSEDPVQTPYKHGG